MELVFFILAVLFTGTVLYSILGALYFGLTGRPLVLALKLSFLLTLVTIAGAVFVGVGGILGVALIMNGALSKLPNYSRKRDISVAVLMSIVSSFVLYYAIFFLAFAIFE